MKRRLLKRRQDCVVFFQTSLIEIEAWKEIFQTWTEKNTKGSGTWLHTDFQKLKIT